MGEGTQPGNTFSEQDSLKILFEYIDEITAVTDNVNSPSLETAKLFCSVLGLDCIPHELAVYLHNDSNAENALMPDYCVHSPTAPDAADEVLAAAAGHLGTQPSPGPVLLDAAAIGQPGFAGHVLAVPITAQAITHGYVIIVFPGCDVRFAADSPQAGFLFNAMHIAALVYHDKKNSELIDNNLATDYLTALPTREYIYEMIIYSLQMSELYVTRFVLLIVRINGLKNINNSLGIFTGDAALKQIGTVVKEAAFASCGDAEPFVGRLSGSDFAIIINLGSPAAESAGYTGGIHGIVVDAKSVDIDAYGVIRTCCEAIIARIKDFIEVYGYKLYLSVNIGASIYPIHGATAEDLLRKADLAKGISKDKTPNSYEIYNNEMDGDVEKALFLSNNLPDAIAQRQFVLFYQAQMDVKTGKIQKAEALIRWQHPERGMIFPGYFIPYAEENGYGIQMDALVLDMVCDQINRWAEKGMFLSVSVNISPKHFVDGLICDTVQRAIETKGVDPAMLKIELLESALVDNFDTTVSAIIKLREMGVAVALDDFGTGYSSLEYVLKLPLDYLKIDREFSMNLEKNPNNKILMETIMTLAGGMKVKTIVEGVENQFQLNYLKSIGADFAQGYFINKPLPVDAFEELLWQS